MGKISRRKETFQILKSIVFETDQIAIYIGDVILYITPEVIFELLRLPRSKKMQPLHITQANKDFADLRTELGIEAGTNLTVGKIEKVMKKREQTFEAQMFFSCTNLQISDAYNYPIYQYKRSQVHKGHECHWGLRLVHSC